jgi:hypothetical protein
MKDLDRGPSVSNDIHNTEAWSSLTFTFLETGRESAKCSSSSRGSTGRQMRKGAIESADNFCVKRKLIIV